MVTCLLTSTSVRNVESPVLHGRVIDQDSSGFSYAFILNSDSLGTELVPLQRL